MALPTASDNVFPKVVVSEQTTPASPSAGQQKLFIDSADHKLKRVNSSGTVTTVEGGGGGSVASDTIWDAKGDLAIGTGADTAAKLSAGTNGQIVVYDSAQTTGMKAASGYLGGLELVYRYTVSGSDKASIDTGADTADAGTNDWTNGDILEIFITAKTDDAGALASADLTVNNDTGSNYDIQRVEGSGTTTSAASSVAATAWKPRIKGSGGTAGYPATYTLQIPTFAGTTFNKSANVMITTPDGTAANQTADFWSFGWRSTAAITRFKIAAQSTAKLKVGTQLLIYKRRNT